jgi:predicted  nucleic acid-binding Zn-ribbon protein
MLSTDPEFKKLLLLHSRDRREKKMLDELNNIPAEIARTEEKILVENQSIELAMEEWKSLEAKNNSLESEILSISEQINRQKNRQLEVKKNEEYQALENEIISLKTKESEKEDEQIEVLVKIDDARETARVAEDKIAKRVVQLEVQKKGLIERESEVNHELTVLKGEIQTSRSEVEEEALRIYDRIKKVVSRPPYLAPLTDQKCSGCNLRVSNDVVSSALVEQKLTQCDQCGRIVYIER